MYRVLVLPVFGIIFSGCFLSSGAEPDAGSPDDASPADSTIADAGDDAIEPECNYLVGHQWCDEQCPRCPAYSLCGSTPVCTSTYDPVGRNSGCDVEFVGQYNRSGEYCARSNQFCMNHSRTMRGWDEGVRGRCVEEVLCQALHLEPGYEHFVCRYSDGTVYDEGPPRLDRCPDLVTGAPGVPELCGGACGDCPLLPMNTSFSGEHVGCIGVNEERGYGICVMNGDSAQVDCGSDFSESIFAEYFDFTGGTEESPGRRATCMRALQEDGTPYERGWLTGEAACDTYTRDFPGVFECSRNPE